MEEQATLEGVDTPVVVLSQVKVYNPIEEGIALMLKKHGSVLTVAPAVDTPEALALAKTNRREMVRFRTSIEDARVKEKAESLRYGKLVDSEAKRITAIAAPIEAAYDKAITDEENRLEAIRQAELEKNRLRIEAHRLLIQEIRDTRETALICRESSRIKQLIDGMEKYKDLDFEEFKDEAELAFNEVCTSLQQLYETKVAAEEQAAENLRQAEANRIEQERLATVAREAAAETERVAAIKAKLDAIRELRTKGGEATTAAEIAELVATGEALVIDASYAEFQEEATDLRELVVNRLKGMHKLKVDSEAEAARLAEEARQIDARQAEINRQARELTNRQLAAKAAQQAESSKPMVKRVWGAVAGPRTLPGMVVDAEIKPAAGPVLFENKVTGETMTALDLSAGANKVIDLLPEATRPTDDEIIAVLADHFDADSETVIGWLSTFTTNNSTATVLTTA